MILEHKGICSTLFKLFIILILILVFAWQSYVIVDKYITSKTSMQISLQDDGEILFPSITFCKKYAFDNLPGIAHMMQEDESVTQENAKMWVKKNVWKRDDLFLFLNHQNMKNFSFPCTAVDGDYPGKPCIFPFR